jgi:hypothetical protein
MICFLIKKAAFCFITRPYAPKIPCSSLLYWMCAKGRKMHNYSCVVRLTLASGKGVLVSEGCWRYGVLPFHCRSRNYATPRLSAEVALVRPETRRSKVTGLSDLMTLFIDLGCLYCKQSQRAFNVKKKPAKLIENWFSRSKVQLTRVWKLLTRRWNAWHWESHCVFTAGGERVKEKKTLVDCQNHPESFNTLKQVK